MKLGLALMRSDEQQKNKRKEKNEILQIRIWGEKKGSIFFFLFYFWRSNVLSKQSSASHESPHTENKETILLEHRW